MTLIELLTAEMIGGIVITAAIMLVVISFNGSQRVSDRVELTFTGRILAAQIDQRIGSQVCLYSGEYAVNGTTVYTGAADSIVFAGPKKLIFFADVNRNRRDREHEQCWVYSLSALAVFQPRRPLGKRQARRGPLRIHRRRISRSAQQHRSFLVWPYASDGVERARHAWHAGRL